ncbi:hypothetical protein, partial [Microvirga calopogonii]|uniref:hypothetical protein n=1 Tax=Microvirga calopogonii TaxID=2078013 RepID=UPI00197C36AA
AFSVELAGITTGVPPSLEPHYPSLDRRQPNEGAKWARDRAFQGHVAQRQRLKLASLRLVKICVRKFIKP